MKICGHCGEQMRGSASITDASGTVWLCHPDEGRDCYHLVTVWGHDPHPGCRQCRDDLHDWESVSAVARRLKRAPGVEVVSDGYRDMSCDVVVTAKADLSYDCNVVGVEVNVGSTASIAFSMWPDQAEGLAQAILASVRECRAAAAAEGSHST